MKPEDLKDKRSPTNPPPKGDKKMMISESVKPPDVDYVESWERSKDPWHADAFPAEFKANAPSKGVRSDGWIGVDHYGNSVAWIPDGEFDPNREVSQILIISDGDKK